MAKMDEKFVAAEYEEIDWGGSGAEGGTTLKKTTLWKNVHVGLPRPLADTHPVKCSLVTGDYSYFHYGCDGQDDRGWGCGYRTIQTMASWLRHNWLSPLKAERRLPPTLPEMQQALVALGDRPDSFPRSREWIGTFEASLVLGYFYDVPCKLEHVRSGGAGLEHVAEELHKHFETHGSPVMMGGDRDNASKGIVGVCTGNEGSHHLLVLDPHYYGGPLEQTELQRRGWVAWRRVSSLDQSSFYNLCMPQTVTQGQTSYTQISQMLV